MNEILLLKLRANIISRLAGIVEWDRYGIRDEDDSGFIYGWIKREDKFYDFVLVRFWIDWEKNGQFFCSYDTSSKEHSKEIGMLLGSDLKNYTECISAKGLAPDNQLVRWQKEQIKVNEVKDQ